MRQYSADQIELSWLGIDFKEGLSAGTFISESLNGSGFTLTNRGATTETTRTYDVNKSGTLTVTVDQTSTLHQKLMVIHRSDRNPASRNQVDTMKINDASSGEKIDYINAHINLKSNFSRGTEAQTFTWVFNFEDFNENPNEANTTNLVGN